MHSRPYGERDAEWSLNADGTVVTGVGDSTDEEQSAEQSEPVDEAIERLNRMRPQELFETFADMELAWGPTWSGSLKSLWLGEGEAIGDIVVGEELAEHLGTEPMHPVLMDLCTGVAFPAFPALLAAEQGVNDLFLPLRYGQVTLQEKMPRRFYCRAKWHESALDSETQVFDLDFVDRDGRQLGGIREFTVKRAPREALLRGLGGDATRLLYTLGWHEVPPAPSDDGAGNVSGTWLIAGFDELAAKVPGCIPFDRNTDPELLGQLLAQAHERGMPFSGVVWRGTEPGRDGVERRRRPRGSRPRSPTCSAPCTPCRAVSVKLPGGLWIVTERAVATESGEPVDPVQAALWGFGRTTINEEPALRARLVDCDGSDEAVHALANLLATPVDEPEIALRQGKLLASRLLPWARSGHLTVPRGGDYVAGAHRARRDRQPAADRDRRATAGRGLRAGPGRGRGPQLPRCAQRPRPVPRRSRPDRRRLRRRRHPIGRRRHRTRGRPARLRLHAGCVRQPVQRARPVPGADPGRGERGRGRDDSRCGADGAAVVRLGAAASPATRCSSTPPAAASGWRPSRWPSGAVPTVFATASTYKRATLRKLGVKYVYDSRTTDFADQILADTDGAGVDVVLNCLTSEGFIEATLRATAQNGRFAEIAKRDIWTPEQMAEARPDIAYEIVALDTVMFTEPRPHSRPAGRGVGGIGQGRVDAAARRDLPADRGEGRVPPHAAGPAHRQDRGADAESAAAAGRSELPDHRRPRCDRPAHGVVSGPTRRR